MKLMLLPSPRLNYPNLARLAGLSILTAVTCLVNLPMAVAVPSKSLQKALLSLYSTYGGASLLREYADECEPSGTANHQAAYDRWLETYQLKGVHNLLYESVGSMAAKKIKQSEQGTLKTKIRESFPNCVNGKQLAAIYASRKMNPTKLNPTALAIIQAALNNTQSADAPDPVGSKPIPSADMPDPIRSKPTQSLGSKIAPLKGIYMEQVTSYGVGGMMTFDFDTYAVFQDGTISKDLNEAFGGKTTRNPKKWGRWQQSGNGFNVTWDNGKTKKLGGSLFYRTFASSSGDRLEGSYRSLGGGGNTALGGDLTIVDSSKIQFYRNGSFEQSSARGGSSGQSTTSSKSSAMGTYTLDGHIIELRYADGRTLRTSFFFFPSKGVKTADSIGIGSRLYSRSSRRR
jgi:hypothetical protein